MISFAVPLCLSYGCKYASKRITSKPNFFIYFLNPRQPGLFKKDDYVSHLSQTMLSHLFSSNRNVTPSKVTLSHNHFRPSQSFDWLRRQINVPTVIEALRCAA